MGAKKQFGKHTYQEISISIYFAISYKHIRLLRLGCQAAQGGWGTSRIREQSTPKISNKQRLLKADFIVAKLLLQKCKKIAQEFALEILALNG